MVSDCRFDLRRPRYHRFHVDDRASLCLILGGEKKAGAYDGAYTQNRNVKMQIDVRSVKKCRRDRHRLPELVHGKELSRATLIINNNERKKLRCAHDAAETEHKSTQ